MTTEMTIEEKRAAAEKAKQEAQLKAKEARAAQAAQKKENEARVRLESATAGVTSAFTTLKSHTEQGTKLITELAVDATPEVITETADSATAQLRLAKDQLKVINNLLKKIENAGDLEIAQKTASDLVAGLESVIAGAKDRVSAAKK